MRAPKLKLFSFSLLALLSYLCGLLAEALHCPSDWSQSWILTRFAQGSSLCSRRTAWRLHLIPVTELNPKTTTKTLSQRKQQILSVSISNHKFNMSRLQECFFNFVTSGWIVIFFSSNARRPRTIFFKQKYYIKHKNNLIKQLVYVWMRTRTCQTWKWKRKYMNVNSSAISVPVIIPYISVTRLSNNTEKDFFFLQLISDQKKQGTSTRTTTNKNHINHRGVLHIVLSAHLALYPLLVWRLVFSGAKGYGTKAQLRTPLAWTS